MKTKIVIAGGGFAELYAAMHLGRTVARRGEAEVVLISRENFILVTPMLRPSILRAALSFIWQQKPTSR